MPPAETPARPRVPRRVLGPYLRDLRQQAGLTVKQAAQLMEWSEPKLWRIETGQTTLRTLDVQAMCAAYGAEPGLARALAGLAAQSRADGWWRAYGGIIPDDFGIYTAWRTPRAHSRGMRPARSRDCCAPRHMPAPSSPAPAWTAKRLTGWSMTAWPGGSC